MSLNDSILRSVGLTDPNFEFSLEKDGSFNHEERRDKDQHIAIVYRANLHGILNACPLCGFKTRFNKDGLSKETEIKLPATNGYDNRLKVQKQRYKCDSCGGRPVVTSPDLDENRNVSVPLRRQVIRLALEDISEKIIAFIIRLSHSSVHRIINEELQNYRYDYSDLPSVLCFDEIRVGHQYAFVYASPDQFMEILPDRNLKTIKNNFYGFSLQQREAVTHIVMDITLATVLSYAAYFPMHVSSLTGSTSFQLMTRAVHHSYRYSKATR